jgi:hypothetical protein
MRFTDQHVEFVRKSFEQFHEAPPVTLGEDDTCIYVGIHSQMALRVEMGEDTDENGPVLFPMYSVSVAWREDAEDVDECGVEPSFADAVVLMVTTWAGETVADAILSLKEPPLGRDEDDCAA